MVALTAVPLCSCMRYNRSPHSVCAAPGSQEPCHSAGKHTCFGSCDAYGWALQGAAAALLRFGAIHTCPVPPAIPAATLAAMPPEQAARMQAERREAQRRAGNSVGGAGHVRPRFLHLQSCLSGPADPACWLCQPGRAACMNGQGCMPTWPPPPPPVTLLCLAAAQSQARTPQRMTEDAVVPRHSYVRVHLHPKRFPAAYSVAWQVSVVGRWRLGRRGSGSHACVARSPGVPCTWNSNKQAGSGWDWG